MTHTHFEIRHTQSQGEVRRMDTNELRTAFLIEGLMKRDAVTLVYSHYDRMITGGVAPTVPVTLPVPQELRANSFLERRELGIINVGGEGRVKVGTEQYTLQKLDCLYVGKGDSAVVFESASAERPAVFYLLSSPAHASHPTRLLTSREAEPTDLGAAETANARTVYKYIHAKGIKSCQLVMGLTVLRSGSVWNTIPPHVHDRRMEVYFYFDVPDDQRVLHLMGHPQETRHLVVANHQAVLSPPWSIHAGCGTTAYSFIWGMAGENFDYTDMDPVPVKTLL